MIAQNGIIFTNMRSHTDPRIEDVQQRISSRLLQHVEYKSTNEHDFQNFEENFVNDVN